MSARVDISSKSANTAPVSRGGGGDTMTQADKIKLAAAVVILVVGGLWICHYLGLFDSMLQSKPDPNIPIVDGKPVPPEEIEEHNRKVREYKEANEKDAAENGPPVGS